MMTQREGDGPRFVGSAVLWGESAKVSRHAYEMAREMMTNARQLALQGELQTDESLFVPICHELSLQVAPIEESGARADIEGHMVKRAVVLRRGLETMTTREVADEAPAHYRTVKRWIQSGKLPARRTATGRIIVLRSDFRKFMGLNGAGE